MKLGRVGVSAGLLALGFLVGYLARGAAGGEAAPPQLDPPARRGGATVPAPAERAPPTVLRVTKEGATCDACTQCLIGCLQ